MFFISSKKKKQEAIEPTTKTFLKISDEPSTSSGVFKRKANDTIDDVDHVKRTKIDECSKSDENETAMTTDENAEISTAPTLENDQTKESNADSTPESSKPRNTSKSGRLLAEKSIEHGTEIDSNLVPQTK